MKNENDIGCFVMNGISTTWNVYEWLDLNDQEPIDSREIAKEMERFRP